MWQVPMCGKSLCWSGVRVRRLRVRSLSLSIHCQNAVMASILDAIVRGTPQFSLCDCGIRRLATVVCACNRSSCTKCATSKHADARCMPVQVGGYGARCHAPVPACQPVQ